GVDAYGIDASDWAIAEASKRVPSGHVFQCAAGSVPLPAALTAHAPFGALVLWAVLEHFPDPFGTLALLAAETRPDALLVINTSNADSATHRLLGCAWEGYVDWTHPGVQQVSVAQLRARLP